MKDTFKIRRATEGDTNDICKIYNSYVRNSIVTFETTPVEASIMKGRIKEKLTKYDWIVGELNQRVVGYSYYGSFRPRAAYSHTVETTIYLSEENTGRGLGRALYAALIRSAKEKGFRELIGVIALPNPESIKLHKSLGFREVGILREIGHKFGKYVDVSLWQRSPETGHTTGFTGC
jgi:L-amino acid N-acyltransferase YncA